MSNQFTTMKARSIGRVLRAVRSHRYVMRTRVTNALSFQRHSLAGDARWPHISLEEEKFDWGMLGGLDISSEWESCLTSLDSLLNDLNDEGKSSKELEEEGRPNATAVKAASEYLRVKLQNGAESPPSIVSLEPTGGIVVEWRERIAIGLRLTRVVFFNDGDCEENIFENGDLVTVKPGSDNHVTDHTARFPSSSYISDRDWMPALDDVGAMCYLADPDNSISPWEGFFEFAETNSILSDKTITY